MRIKVMGCEIERACRVLRGGSWLNRLRDLRSAFRIWSFADEAVSIAGFRLVGVSKDEE